MGAAEFYVYEHWRPDTNKCFYVGKGKGKRAHNMGWRNPYHKAIQVKLRRLGMEVAVKIIQSGLNEEAAFALEQALIASWRASGLTLVNQTGGGEGISGASEEVRRKIGQSKIGNKNMVGRKLSDDTRRKISLAHVGKEPNWDLIAKLAEINKGHRRSYGKRASQETRRKMSESHMGNKYALGWKMPDEQKEHMRRINIGKKMSPEAIERTTAAHRKPVICVTDGRRFKSAIDAGKFYGLFNHAKVAEVCRGVRKTAAGRVFSYEVI